MASNLGDLAAIAGLVYGAKRRREARREERAEKAEVRKLRLDQFAQQKMDAEARRKAEEGEQALKRADYFKEGLFGPGSQDFLHGLAQSPEAFTAFMGAATPAFKAAGLPFDAGAYIPQAPPSQENFADFAARLPSPDGAAARGPWPDAVSPLGPQPKPPAPPPFDLGAALRERYQPSVKVQSLSDRVDIYGRRVEQQGREGEQRIEESKSRIQEREKRLEPALRLMEQQIKNLQQQGKLAEARTVLTNWQAVIAEGTPEWRTKQLELLGEGLGLKRESLGETKRHHVATEGITVRGQDMDAQLGRARLELQSRLDAAKVNPLRQLAYRQLFDVLLNRSTNSLTGEQRFQYDDAERNRALAGLQRMSAEDGQDLSELLGSGGGGAAAGAAAEGGSVDPFVRQVGGMDARAYDAYFKGAPTAAKAGIRQARAEAVRLGLVKGARR